jgi:phosphatidate cytidylyltransferase
MLRTRILTALVLTAFIVALTASRHPAVLLIASVLLALVGGAEYMALRRLSLEPRSVDGGETSHPKLVAHDWLSGLAYAAIPVLVFGLFSLSILGILSVVLAWVSVSSLMFGAMFVKESGSLERATAQLFAFIAGFLYVGLPAVGLWALAFKTLDTAVPCSAFWFVVAVVFMGDTGAYFVGRSLGRHKLIPRISPKKTVEGSVGGLVSSALTAVFLAQWFGFEFSPVVLVAIGTGLGIAGQVGDLVESALKRSANCKDSSRWFPGHGGMLDRVDSLLFSIPLALPLFFLG